MDPQLRQKLLGYETTPGLLMDYEEVDEDENEVPKLCKAFNW